MYQVSAVRSMGYILGYLVSRFTTARLRYSISDTNISRLHASQSMIEHELHNAMQDRGTRGSDEGGGNCESCYHS